MDTCTLVRGGGLPTTPHPLNTSSHNTAARRPPHPSYTQQHTTTHNNTQQHYTTAFGYIKLPMYQFFLWRLYLMVLRGATSLLGALEGKSRLFRAQISGPKKVLIFRAHPFQCPLKWCCTPQNHYVLRHKYNRYINSYNIAEIKYTSFYPVVMQSCTKKANIMYTGQSFT
jgi:hypothetical protein